MRSEARVAAGPRGCLALALILLAPPVPAADVRERILAVVDGRPVFLSEVRLRTRVAKIPGATALEELIDEVLMYQQAARMPQAALTPEEEERAYQDARAKLPEAGSGDEADLRRLARRQGTILKYVAFRFRPQVQVTDDAVREAYAAQHGGRPGAPALDDASSALREALTTAALGARLEEWVKELRGAAAVRYVRPGP